MVLYKMHGLLKFSNYVWPSDKVTAQVTCDYKWMKDHRRPRSMYLYVTYISETLRTPFLSKNPKLSRILYNSTQSIQYILNEAWIVLRLHHIITLLLERWYPVSRLYLPFTQNKSTMISKNKYLFPHLDNKRQTLNVKSFCCNTCIWIQT